MFQAFNSLLHNFTGTRSLCFQVPTAVDLSLMLTFFRCGSDRSGQK